MIYLLMTIVFSIMSFLFISKVPSMGKHLNYRISKYGVIYIVLISGLLFAQMIMYPPGSNISPYAYTHGLLNQILFLGRTISSWLSMLLTGYCIFEVLVGGRKIKLEKTNIIMFLCVILTAVVGIVSYSSISTGLSEGVKYLLPFLVYGMLMSIGSNKMGEPLSRLFTYTNFILIIQVLLSKIFTGRFAASTYYLELREEYFGFYNHPHNFTGMLGMLTTWCFFNINRRYYTKLNIFLVFLNVGLMYISGSRSYVYSLLVAAAYILVFSLVDTKLKRMRKYSLFAFAFAILFGGVFFSHLGSNRVTDAVLSGRGLRWISDLQYYLYNTTIVQKIFGGGFGFISDVNRNVFGVYINSLNIVIDVLLNNGIIGLILTIMAYSILFKYFIKVGNKHFSIMMMLYFVVSSMVTNLITYQVVTIYMVLILYSMMVVSNQEKRILDKLE